MNMHTYTKNKFQIVINGTIGGKMWLPAALATMKFHHVVDSHKYLDGKTTLRHEILDITNCGDFQDSAILDGYIQVTLYDNTGKRVRYFDLTSGLFESIKDCIEQNPERFDFDTVLE